MKHIAWIVIASLLLATSSVFADGAELLMRRANRFFSPLPDVMPGSENDTPERIALGTKLYFEKHLSINDSQACATCHRLEEGYAGVDNSRHLTRCKR
jgi:cytochrome c peroxidase